jgi:hypothetical protein
VSFLDLDDFFRLVMEICRVQILITGNQMMIQSRDRGEITGIKVIKAPVSLQLNSHELLRGMQVGVLRSASVGAMKTRKWPWPQYGNDFGRLRSHVVVCHDTSRHRDTLACR